MTLSQNSKYFVIAWDFNRKFDTSLDPDFYMSRRFWLKSVWIWSKVSKLIKNRSNLMEKWLIQYDMIQFRRQISYRIDFIDQICSACIPSHQQFDSGGLIELSFYLVAAMAVLNWANVVTLVNFTQMLNTQRSIGENLKWCTKSCYKNEVWWVICWTVSFETRGPGFKSLPYLF